MAVILTNMKTALVQKTIVDNYFSYLKNAGYLDDKRTEQVLFMTLLLDTFNDFKEFITEEFTEDVQRIINSLGCCNCIMSFNKLL